jgi:hypothetical protein
MIRVLMSWLRRGRMLGYTVDEVPRGVAACLLRLPSASAALWLGVWCAAHQRDTRGETQRRTARLQCTLAATASSKQLHSLISDKFQLFSPHTSHMTHCPSPES